MALTLVIGYGSGIPLPYLAPIMALVLALPPGAPMTPRALLGLIAVVLVTLGVGLVVTPLLQQYPLSAVLVIAAGLYFSTYLSVNRGKALVGTLIGVGFTLIPVAGTVDFGLAVVVVQSLVFAIALAIVVLWVVYPWFPEDPGAPLQPAPPATAAVSNWIALRTTLIVLPAVLLALANPSMYLPLVMKSIMLAQQGSVVTARAAGRELLGSTFVAGWFAIAFWLALKLRPDLWMFFGLTLLFGVFLVGKIYQVFQSRYPPTFWQNVGVTLLILIGPAVEDAENGKDVYAAFVVRLSLFFAVTFYAWAAIAGLERLRARRIHRLTPPHPLTEPI